MRAAEDELKIARTRVELRKAHLELEETEVRFRERQRQVATQRHAEGHRQAEARMAADPPNDSERVVSVRIEAAVDCGLSDYRRKPRSRKL